MSAMCKGNSVVKIKLTVILHSLCSTFELHLHLRTLGGHMLSLWQSLCYLALLTGVAQPGEVQCNKLSPPDHGSINATDSNNLYSKITYSCDTGYNIQGT